MDHIASFGYLLKAHTVTVGLALGFLINLLLILYILAKLKLHIDIHSEIGELALKLREEIRFSVEPKFLQLSPELNVMTDLAIEVWRIGQKINSPSIGIHDNQKKGFENSLAKLNRCLEKFDLQIVDYTGQKFNTGLTVDVLSTEKDPSITEAVIKTTMEPTVLYKNQVIKKAKVIVLQK